MKASPTPGTTVEIVASNTDKAIRVASVVLMLIVVIVLLGGNGSSSDGFRKPATTTSLSSVAQGTSKNGEKEGPAENTGSNCQSGMDEKLAALNERIKLQNEEIAELKKRNAQLKKKAEQGRWGDNDSARASGREESEKPTSNHRLPPSSTTDAGEPPARPFQPYKKGWNAQDINFVDGVPVDKCPGAVKAKYFQTVGGRMNISPQQIYNIFEPFAKGRVLPDGEKELRIPQYDQVSTNWPLILQRCRHKIFAQGKQDGIILCIFAAIGFTNKVFVEFGFNNFFESNSAVLHMLGWRGLFMDGHHQNKEINSFAHHINTTHITKLLELHNIPKQFDYLSADLDSVELYVVDAIIRGGYRPRVWSIEYNCHVPLEFNWTVPYNFEGWKNGNCYYGLSLGAAVSVAESLGYKLVAVDLILDAFFVDAALLPADVELPPITDFHPYMCPGKFSLHRCADFNKYEWADLGANGFPPGSYATYKDFEEGKDPSSFGVKTTNKRSSANKDAEKKKTLDSLQRRGIPVPTPQLAAQRESTSASSPSDSLFGLPEKKTYRESAVKEPKLHEQAQSEGEEESTENEPRIGKRFQKFDASKIRGSGGKGQVVGHKNGSPSGGKAKR